MSKGQFFIISAVIMVTTLIAVYAVYQGYYAVDTSEVQVKEEGFVVRTIETRATELFNEYAQDNCSIYRDAIGSFELNIEANTRQRGQFLAFDDNTTRGCLWSNFTIDFRTKDTRVLRKWNMNATRETEVWSLDTQTELEEEYEFENITITNGKINLTSDSLNGFISYGKTAFNATGGGGVTWALHNFNGNIPKGTSVEFVWKTNESGSWVTYSSFGDLPDYPFFHLNQTIRLKRPNTSVEIYLEYTNVTYVTDI